MTCNKVVYISEFISGYCGLKPEHKEQCKIVPEESVIQVCKQILIERGEVVLPHAHRPR